MPRFTAIVVDREAGDYKRCVVSAKNSDDVGELCKSFIFDQAIKDGSLSKEDLSGDLTQQLEALFVCVGDHPNLIVPDTNVIDITIPEGWEVPDYYIEAGNE